MKGKIALEEHFAIEATLGDSQVFGPHVWPELRSRLIDIQTKLIASMDQNGIGMMILSLNAPAVQAIADPKRRSPSRKKQMMRLPSMCASAPIVLRPLPRCRCRIRMRRSASSSGASKN